MEKVLFVALLFFLYSCADDNPVVIEEKGIDIDSVINNTNTEFIYFEDKDIKYFFPEETFIKDFSNMYMEEADQLNINMKSDNQYRCDIFISGADIFSLNFPQKVGSFREGSFGHANMQLIDQLKDVQNQFASDDDYNFSGSTLYGSSSYFYLTIYSLENRLISCSFGGVIETSTGRRIIVQNGKLRILIKN